MALTDLPLARTLLAARNLPARLMGSFAAYWSDPARRRADSTQHSQSILTTMRRTTRSLADIGSRASRHPADARGLQVRASGLLQLLGITHAAVGVIKYRSELAAIASDGVFNAVTGHPERLVAFWFLVVAPALWMCGRALAVAEFTGHLKVQVAAGRLLIGLGLVGILAMPTSPFWALGAVGVIALRNGSPRRSPTPESRRHDVTRSL